MQYYCSKISLNIIFHYKGYNLYKTSKLINIKLLIQSNFLNFPINMLKYNTFNKVLPLHRTFQKLFEPYPSWVPYYHWRNAEIFAAIFNAAGLLVATFDYEHHYSGNRNHYNCEEGEMRYHDRWVILFLTCLAILFTILRYYLQLQWFKKKNRTNSKQVLTFDLYRSFRRKAIFHLCLEVLYLSIFPYPGLDSSTNISTVQYLVESTSDDANAFSYNLCYTLAEMLYAIMFFRIILIIRAFLIGALFQDDLSYFVCSQFKETANFSYTIRCYIRSDPLLTSVFTIVPFVFIFGTLMRIFERPFMDISGKNFESYLTAVWCAGVSMTTIGYGDIMPSTHFGRMIALFCAFWGLFMFSILVSALDAVFQLSTTQNKAFLKTENVRASAYLVRAALQYNYAKKYYGLNDYRTLALYELMLKEVDNFRSKFIRSKKIGLQQNNVLASIVNNLAEVTKQLNRIEERLATLDTNPHSSASHTSSRKVASLSSRKGAFRIND